MFSRPPPSGAQAHKDHGEVYISKIVERTIFEKKPAFGGILTKAISFFNGRPLNDC
jgi:hypothetical protein